MYNDKTLTCKDCGCEFTFTASEQEFFAEKGFTNEPQRCKPCRDARKGKPARRGPPKDGKRLDAKALRRGKKVVLHEEERVPIDSEQVAAKEIPHRHVPVTHAWQREVARSPPHERLPLAICERIGQGIWLDRPVPVVKAMITDVLDHLGPLPHLHTRPSPKPTAAALATASAGRYPCGRGTSDAR